MESEEAKRVNDNIETLLKFLTEESLTKVNREGPTYLEEGVEHITILPKNGACVFLLEEHEGFRQCLFEKLYEEGKINFQKPISCHLFPLIYRQNRYHKVLSFQRRKICVSSWSQGGHIFRSVEPALKRKFGEAFVTELFQKLDITT